MFKVDDLIIYKKDLCRIKKIEKNPKINEEYYVLSPIEDESLSIKVPTSNKLNNLRYPMTKQAAEKLIQKIPTIEPLKITDKSLENTYLELLKTNKHEDLIKIIKTTYLRNEARLNQRKKVGDKDKLFFQKAETYLYNELAYSLGLSYEECKSYIKKKVEENIQRNQSHEI